jgi:hypothetical protein
MSWNSYLLVFGAIAGTLTLASFHTSNQVSISKFKTIHSWSFGSPGGKTGAPIDGVCTDCHIGTVQNGSAMNTVVIADQNGPVSQYTPGMDYQVTVSMNTNNAKNGFEIVPLTNNNTQAGTISTLDNNTQFIDLGTTKRITHNFAGTALTSWTFNWNAPNTNVGDITFYLATNLANNNTGGDGDVIYASQHIIGSTASINENSPNFDLSVNYNSSTNSIALDINAKEGGDVAINLVDMTGKSVQFEQLGKASAGENTFNVKLDKHLQKGIYIVNINVNNHFVTKKIYID